MQWENLKKKSRNSEEKNYNIVTILAFFRIYNIQYCFCLRMNISIYWIGRQIDRFTWMHMSLCEIHGSMWKPLHWAPLFSLLHIDSANTFRIVCDWWPVHSFIRSHSRAHALLLVFIYINQNSRGLSCVEWKELGGCLFFSLPLSLSPWILQAFVWLFENSLKTSRSWSFLADFFFSINIFTL